VKAKIALAVAIAAAAAMTSGFAQSHAEATVTKGTHLPSLCAKSYDPYREPVSVLRSCGDTIYKLQRVTPLPGGGKAYDYGAYTQLVPPPHFNVLKASDRQLREYALPTRRQYGSRWHAMVRRMRSFVRPAPYLVGLPVTSRTAPIARTEACDYPSCSHNWSGYVAYAGHNYNSVGAGWFEPDFTSGSCSSTSFFQWTGIGGFNGGTLNLGQDGTAFGFPGLGAHQAWIETSENGTLSPPVGISTLFATVDQKFVASASYDSSTKKYDYSMGNDATGKTWSGTSRAVTGVDLSSAEVITERPTLNGQYTDLTPYGNFTVTNPGVGWGSTGSSNFVNLPAADKSPVTMEFSNGNVMSKPSSLNSSNSDFTMTFVRCDG